MPKLSDIKEKASERKAAPKAAKTNKSPYISSNKARGFARKRIILHGPSGHGKTRLAATLSGQFPPDNFFDKPIKQRKWVDLKDTLWVPFDNEATACLYTNKIDVPDLNISEILEEYELPSALAQIQEVIFEYYEQNKPKLVVVDTISKLDTVLNAYWWAPENIPISKGGKEDTMRVWVNIGNTHQRFFSMIDQLPCDVIFCFHTKAAPMAEGDSPMAIAARRKQEATALPGIADKEINITGKAAGIYKADHSLILPVIAKPAGSGKFIREIFTVPLGGFEAKCRYAGLDPKEPAHLGKLFDKIKANL